MKATKLAASAMVTSVMIVAFPVTAVECEGSNTFFGQPLELLHETKDGAKTFYVRNDYIVTVLKPDGVAFDGAKGRCTGIWQTASDGSQVGGDGTCYLFDGDGDTYVSDWSRRVPEQGVWKVRNGTGKFADDTSGGTYSGGLYRYSGGFSRNTWDGECATLLK